jgi:Flp pilus assembly protein TadG
MLLRNRGKTGQEGQAMVETALIILVVLLLLMGIIEFGLLFFAYVRVSNATREGARAGSLWLRDRKADNGYYDPILCDTVRDAIWSEVDAIQEDQIAITLASGVVSCPDTGLTPQSGEAITVTVGYDYDLPVVSSLPIIGPIISSPFPVSRMVVMRFQ